MAKQLDNVPPARVDAHRYAASVRGLLAVVVRKLPDSARAVLLIGHNPRLEELVADLGGVGWPMKTSSIAVLSSRSEWAEGSVPVGQSSKVSLTPGSRTVREDASPTGDHAVHALARQQRLPHLAA